MQMAFGMLSLAILILIETNKKRVLPKPVSQFK